MSPRPPDKTRSDKSCFPSCFRFSRSVSDCTGTKEQRRFSWWWSRVRKSGVKLVPMDAAAILQQAKRGGVSGLEAEKSVRQTGKRPISGKMERNSGRKQDAGDVLSDHGRVGKPRKPKYGRRQPPSEAQIPNPDSGNPTTTSTASRDATCQKPARPAVKTGSRPRPPEIKLETEISHQKHDGKNDNVIGKFDPTVGLLILMVTLAIILLCGRMCAIVCTSAWFYLIPLMRPATNSGDVTGNAMDSEKPDLDSEEHKKKVILEGLLQRNRRTRPVIIL